MDARQAVTDTASDETAVSLEDRSDTDPSAGKQRPDDASPSTLSSSDPFGEGDTGTSALGGPAADVEDADIPLAVVSGERVRPRSAGPYPVPDPPLPSVPPPPGRLHRWLVRAVVALVAVNVGLVGLNLGWLVLGPRTPTARPTAVATAPPAAAARAEAAAGVSEVLSRQTAALRAHDSAGFAATLDPAAVSASFRAQQAASFAHLAGVPVVGWNLSLDGVDAFALSPARRVALQAGDPRARTATAQVQLTYGLAGADQRPVDVTEYLTFVDRDGHWYLAGTADGAAVGHTTPVQLWDLGPVTVVHGSHALVLGVGAPATLQRYAAVVDAAVPTVNLVWGTGWPQQAVVVVPGSEVQMAALLGGAPATYSGIAAVTTGELGNNAAAADRIIVNPDAFERLSAVGRRVIMTHELTHVATRTFTGPSTPTWLSEGAADFTGYLGSGVPIGTVLAEARPNVAARHLPADLPTAADFHMGGANLSATYELSWAACRMVAGRWGQAKLVALYKAVNAAGGTPDQALNTALGSVLHVNRAQFVQQWQAYLVQLVG